MPALPCDKQDMPLVLYPTLYLAVSIFITTISFFILKMDLEDIHILYSWAHFFPPCSLSEWPVTPPPPPPNKKRGVGEMGGEGGNALPCGQKNN